MFESIEANSYDVSINSPGISTFTLESVLQIYKYTNFITANEV